MSPFFAFKLKIQYLLSNLSNDPQIKNIYSTIVPKNGGILLANSKVPKIVYPTCHLGRQKSLENVRKKRYCSNFEVDSPTVSGGLVRQNRGEFNAQRVR
jgi:hypothetical protein